MSTDPQSYFPNPSSASHQQPNAYYMPNTNIDPQYSMGIRNPNSFNTPRPGPQYMNPPMSNGYQPPFYPQVVSYIPPFVGTRPMNNSYFPVIRPMNEPMPTSTSYVPNPAYFASTNNSIPSTPSVYTGQYYPGNFQMAQNYSQVSTSSMPNSQLQTAQSYPMTPNIAPQTQILSAPPNQHQQVEQLHQQTSQTTTAQNIPSMNPNPLPQQAERRKKTPIAVVDPVSHKVVDISGPSSTPNSSTVTAAVTSTATSSSTTTTNTDNRQNESNTDSTTQNTKSNVDTNKTQKQEDFRRQFATAFGDNSNAHSDKTNQSITSTDDTANGSSAKQNSQKTSEVIVQSSTSASSRSGSMTRPKSPVSISATNDSLKQAQPAHPGILTRNTPDEKLSLKLSQDDKRDAEFNEMKSEKVLPETKSTYSEPQMGINEDANSNRTESQPASHLSSSGSLECVTPPQTPSAISTNDKSQALLASAPNQRLRYDRHELLRIRDSSAPFPIPNLPDLDIVVSRRDLQRASYPSYTGAISQGGLGNRSYHQISSSNHPSLSRYSTNSQNKPTDSKRKTGIFIPNEPDFGNRVENPYKPIDQNKIDANNKVLRDVKSILNKVTPQTYDKLQKQLETLEIDRYERLEGMINIFFSKAVDEPAFSFLYAKLCKQFQKKQVTVPSEDGKTVTHYFRQILLTRCQKEFENDYRQEIEYERRKNEVESITDEKKRKEDAEKLEEDLVKAKRRKLGNIFFIGELFKLQMLTDTIMYDCIEYLLRDKTDEEALECLCRLLRTIGKELDGKANEKSVNKTNLEKHYRELNNIVKEQKTSARIRFMIQDLIELREASWVARRAETKPITIDEIHEQERLKREQQEREQDRDRQQRRDPNRQTVIGNMYSGNNQQQYNEGRNSRGSGMKQQTSRNDDDRTENRFNVNSLRQLQSNDKRNQGPIAMNLAPQRTWAKGSGIDKKPEDDRSSSARSGKPPAGPVQQLKGKTGSSQGASYALQRQSSRELARESSQRDRENALQSLRKTTGGSGVNSPNVAGSSSMANSREGSRNVSREQSRNASRESSVSERTSNVGLSTQLSKSSTSETSAVINEVAFNASFDEEKIQARVHSLIEEYTENYSETHDRPVKEALEDLAAFCTQNLEQQSIIVRELFTNVLEAKPRARKAVGHILDAALNDNILLADSFLSGCKMIVEAAPDYAVDIPLIWQYIGEIVGAFIGAPSSNMFLLKPIMQFVPDDKSKQFFQYVIRFATDFSSQSRVQKFWSMSGFSLNDLFKSELIDASFLNEYNWLFDTPNTSEPSTPQSKESLSPRADPELVKLFKSVNDQGSTVNDPEIISYIHENMDPNEKFYIRNIVLSYLEACLINRDPQKKIQEDIAKKRMTILNSIIEHKPEAEIQAVYAIQNFVSKLEHPPKMARLLFDIFYDEECVSEDAFFEWLKHPDQSETEGHSVVEMSTKDFFTWLQQAETEVEEGEEEEEGN